MSKKVLTPDPLKKQVFRWDKHQRIISLPHPQSRDVLFYELGEDFNFRFLRSEPKSNIQLEKIKPH